MKFRFIVIAMLMAGLAACGDSGAGKGDVSLSAVAAAKGDSTQVMGGVSLQFNHYVRSSKDVDLPGGSVQHRMNIEYADMDQAQLANELRKEVSAKGYVLVGPSDRNGTAQYYVVSGKERKGTFSITPVGPALHLHLVLKDAGGVIYAEWKTS